MSQNISEVSAHPRLLPSFPSHQAVQQALAEHPPSWERFWQLPISVRQELLDFCIGKHGLRITYDPVFRQIFHPQKHTERLESLLSSVLGKKVNILEILPREGTRLTETGSFIIMDILVRLSDGSYANVEMQKIGYRFPLARADCYASDIIMRQYEKAKSELRQTFSFASLHKVYCIILMEESPPAFHSITNQYIHKRSAVFDTGIYPNSAGLHEDIFICLDIFRSIVHTITKRSTLQEAWLTFLSAADVNSISALTGAFPMFLPIYQEIADFAQNPKELMNMFSEALRIMDHNLERQMVEEIREECKAKLAAAEALLEEKERKLEAKVKAQVQAQVQAQIQAQVQEAAWAETKAEIFRLRLLGKSAEEITQELALSPDTVQEVLSTVNQ